MAHARELVGNHFAKGVILSPRDLEPGQLGTFSGEILAKGGELLFDPQCFARDADHKRLLSHKYWQLYRSATTAQILGAGSALEIIKALAGVALNIQSKKHILPGVLANPVSMPWFTFQERMIEAGNIVFRDQSFFPEGKLFSTIALSYETMLDEAQIEAIVERSAKWAVDGFYIVPQSQNYLVNDPIWLGNLLILAAGLKLHRKTVIVGYGNHQMLALASANVDSIASGTWLNVRSFDPDKFYIPEEDEKSRRTTWYYCPQALSEFKLPFLDVAQRTGLLNEMQSVPPSAYAIPLFTGAVPTTINWGEQNAFRHYLSCLNHQITQARKADFSSTLAYHQTMLDSAQAFLKKCKANGVLAGDREFTDIFDVNRAALALLVAARGHQLSRSW